MPAGMRPFAYSLSNLTLIILSIKIKSLTKNEKEKIIGCSFVDFIALYSHATISHLTPFTICVVVYESTSDVMNLFIKLQLFIKLALASTHPQYLCLSWTRLVTLVDSYIQATTSFINFVEYVRAFDVSL